jgi:hypothetical protein
MTAITLIILGIATTLEFAVVGLVILIGVGADEIIKGLTARRRIAEVRRAKGWDGVDSSSAAS